MTVTESALRTYIDNHRKTLCGVAVPNPVAPYKDAWAQLDDFKAKTGLPFDFVHPYPGGHELGDQLNAVRQTIARYPGSGILFNTHLDKLYTTSQLTEFALELETLAQQVPFFIIETDEIDRSILKKGVNLTTFLTNFEVFAEALVRAPRVDLALCLTGWDFANRIGQFDPIVSYYRWLLVDNYWQHTAGGVQGTPKDLADSSAWAKAHGKLFGLGESGAEAKTGTNTADPALVSLMYADAKKAGAQLVCYYQGSAPGAPFTTAILDDAGRAAYAAGVRALG